MTQAREKHEYDEAAKVVFAAESSEQTDAVLAGLGTRLLNEFSKAEQDRAEVEKRWLQDLRQYKGKYDPEVLDKIGAKRSKAFVRKTRVKVKTADSRVEDLLFPSGSEKNWEISNTPVPTVDDQERQEVINRLHQAALAQATAARQAMKPGDPMPEVPEVTRKMVDDAVLQACKEASTGMSKVIDDQLSEIRYKQICKKVMHSSHLYGTGILKGPLVERRIRTKYVKQKGKWIEKSETYAVPFIDYVPLWRFYPDMGAESLDKCRYTYERHLMTHSSLAELAAFKSFRGERIKEYLLANPMGAVRMRDIDSQLKIIGSREAKQGDSDGRYEVLERWGYLTGQELHEVGVAVPQDRLHESFFSNVWLLPNGTVIKAVLQPLNGVTWPYHIYYFDKDETSIFGEGLATIMRDDQIMLNAATRLMLDNAAISSGPMIEVNKNLLANLDQGTEIEPWKVFYRNTTNPNAQAVRGIELPIRLNELSALADRFENNSDEVSAIPRYMTGENVSTGAAGTASGMSMLMGASNIMIKDLISSWDEGVTRSFFTAIYRWNMQFNPDNRIKGDFDVKARGTASLVAREVRAQQLDMFAASVSNPMDAPFIKRHNLLRQRAEANELTDIVKTEEEVEAEQSNPMAAMQMQMAQMQSQLAMAEMQKKVALLEANAAKAMAQVELLRAQIVDTRVGTVYSALQAGGVAAGSPHIAPAGDEILRSSGFVDATPTPPISDLMTMQGGQAGAMPVQGGPNPASGEVPDPQAAMTNGAEPQGQHVGMQAGIEAVAA